MGICNSKTKIKFAKPDLASNIIKLYTQIDKELMVKAIRIFSELNNNEELKEEYYYLRKIIIVTSFLIFLPKLFNDNFTDMKLFLEQNKIPSFVYNNIYNYCNKEDSKIRKYIDNFNNKEQKNIDDINIEKSLLNIKCYIYDIILI